MGKPVAEAKPGPAVAASRVPEGEIRYPASLGQQRYWTLDRLDPGDPSLNLAVRWRLEGELSVDLIEKAFGLILSRHEALRTHFIEVDGEPIQAVQPAVLFRIPTIDLTALAEADAWAESDRIAQAEARNRFNLAIAPLIRATHIRVCGSVAMLLVTTHRAICDDWSIGLLAREVGEICEALQAARPFVLPALPDTYGEYACRQKRFIAEGGHTADVRWWSRTLNDIQYFELPTDLPRRPVPLSISSIRSVQFDRELTDALSRRASDHGATMFVAALAGLLTLLYRYTDATDITLGTQTAGRSDAKFENLVGPFTNALVLRIRLTGTLRFTEYLAQVRDAVAGALEYGDVPFQKIIETLKPERYPGQNAIFSINFTCQRSPIENADHGKFRLVDMPAYSAGVMYDLNFSIVERADGWRASCEYDTGLYEEKTIDRLLRHFVNILEAVAADPSLRLSEIPVVDAAERHHLLFRCNETAANYPGHLTLPQLFDRQAERTPTASAVVDSREVLSYADVARRSDRLAAEISRLGIGPGAKVGVFVKRSADLVIAPLAIMKTGNAYVPLDPVYPIGRLRQIAEQSGLSAIVAQSAVLTAPLAEMAPYILVDRLPERGDDPAAAGLPAISADDTAYMIFTSGSTGRPKGVQIPHRALTNFLWSMRSRPGFTAQDTIVAVTTICFDIAVLELFLPLTVGARTVIASDDEVRDGRLLLSRLRRSGARVLQATPTTWRMLIEAGWQGEPGLRMLCGGEAMPRRLADQLLALSPELWNMYGPTETTIWSSAQRVTVDDRAVPIGVPIANTQFYVVDRRDEPVPQGAAGELLIGGDGVAIGYWNMPVETQERFVPDKFRNLSKARLYRTGDIVRMRRDREWQFLGRTDGQIKIRGFRIELGEIEAALLRHPDVWQAAAISRTGGTREPAIFAYVELADATRRDAVVGELRTQLMQALPSYMHPAEIEVLDAMPRLPNGKIDRKGLPWPVRIVPVREASPPPSNEVERRLKEIWCAVLGLDTIDETADFFRLGGHSLLAVRLLAQVEAEFGRRIRLSALVDAPSFAAFAERLQSPDHRDFDFRQIARLQPRSAKSGIFAVHNTGLFTTLSRSLGEELPMTGLQLLDPSFPTDPLPASMEELAGQYLKLIQRLQPHGPYALLGFCSAGVLAFEIARQLQASGEPAGRVVVIDTWAPGYLANLAWPHSTLAEMQYRWRLMAADWADLRAGHRTLRSFLFDREIFRELFRRRKNGQVPLEAEDADSEGYDHWLTEYLDRMVGSYRPKPFPCQLTVIRSAREPAGRFLDPKFGWEAFATAGVDVITVPGGHIAVFGEPAVSVIAPHVRAAVLADFRAAASAAVPAAPAGS